MQQTVHSGASQTSSRSTTSVNLSSDSIVSPSFDKTKQQVGLDGAACWERPALVHSRVARYAPVMDQAYLLNIIRSVKGEWAMQLGAME